MHRDLDAIAASSYDVIIIGGGIYGATLLWEVTQRGLSAVLLEKDDFGAATSANSLKIIHGGLRYLQHADIRRMRHSMLERRSLMKTAPHLIHPLPVLLPTYGHGMKGREIMAAAMLLNDALSMDRNRLNDPQKFIPRGHTMSRGQVLALLPHLPQDGLTGAAVFYDGRVYNAERHILAFIQTAVEAGAHAANYAPVTGFLRRDDTITGVEVTDTLHNRTFEIRGRLILNSAGPWIHQVLELPNAPRNHQRLPLSLAFNIITPPQFEHYAVGINAPQPYRDQDALLGRGTRLLFVVPWRGLSMIGTEYLPYSGHPDDVRVYDEDIANFVDSWNAAYPAAGLDYADVRFVHHGLLPMSGFDVRSGTVQLHKHPIIEDHRQDGIKGMVSIHGVKYTTARAVAQDVVSWIFENIYRISGPPSKTAELPLHGGHIDQMETYTVREVAQQAHRFPPAAVRRLIQNYGSAYSRVLHYVPQDMVFARDEDTTSALLIAETQHAIWEESAQRLADVVFRRTELGTAGHPGMAALELCAQTMAATLNWSPARQQQELQAVLARFPASLAVTNEG